MNDRGTDPRPNKPGVAVQALSSGDIMSLLSKAIPEAAFFKAGIYGEAGSGKSYTSSLIAIGLVKLLKTTKPVGYADTETGSDFLLPLFEREQVPLVRTKTRAFADLLTIVDEAEKECSVLVIDSITHFWNELMESYMKKNELKRITLKHWGPIKATWAEFTTRFVNSKLHIIVAGRSADKWEEVEDPEDGAKELKKVGTKMRTESSLAYEPSLLVEMEAVQLSARIGGKLVHRCHVRKDRFDVINGLSFDDPTLDTFMPHIALLNLGGEHKAIEPGRDSTGMFDRTDIGELKSVQREIKLEKITALMLALYPSQSESDKTAKRNLMKDLFGTLSWTEVSRLFSQDKLDEGIKNLELMVLQANSSPAEPEPVKPTPADPANGNGKPKAKGARA